MPESGAGSIKILSLLSLLLVLSLSSWGSSKKAGQPDGPSLQLREFRFDDLEASLQTMPLGPEHDYFAGMLANRQNNIAESIRLLNGALPLIRTSRPDRAAIALQALADDYMKSFHYAEAATADDDLLSNFPGQLDAQELKGTKDDAGIVHILRNAPPQTISLNGTVRLRTERNPLNSLNVQLNVNGVQGPWLLDTGANLSVVSQSFAQRLGLKPLPGVAETQAGLTGIENPLQVALLPTLQMGAATLHNVVIMILNDANLNISMGNGSYQINGIIGYPIFQALGTVTFLHDGEFEAGNKPADTDAGARMYMSQLTPLVECNVEGRLLPFGFDTGASDTNFFVRYYEQFHAESKIWKKTKVETGGAGGTKKLKVSIQPLAKVGIGDKIVILRKVPIYMSRSESVNHAGLYGNLGQDVVANFESFTLDFSTMTFSLGAPLSPLKTD